MPFQEGSIYILYFLDIISYAEFFFYTLSCIFPNSYRNFFFPQEERDFLCKRHWISRFHQETRNTILNGFYWPPVICGYNGFPKYHAF